MSGYTPPGPTPPPEEPPGSPPAPAWPAAWPAPDHSSALREAAGTRKLAAWALGLSFVFCMPLAALIAIGLAITALVQGNRARRDAGSGPRHDYGTGMAIAAIPIGVLSLGIGVALIVAGVLSDSDSEEAGGSSGSEETTSDSGNRQPSTLRLGDCFDEPKLEDLGPATEVETGLVRVVPCTDPHNAEVYLVLQVPDGAYPGQQAIDREAATCAREFKDFVGVPYGRSDLDFVYYFPSEESWEFLDDRAIVCTMFDPQTGKVTGSFAGSRR